MPWKECHVMDERLRFVARLLEGVSGLIQRLSADVAVGLHHLGRDVSHLRVNDPIGQSLLSKRRDRGVSAVVEAHFLESRCLADGPPGCAP